MSRFLLGFQMAWLSAKFIRSAERTEWGEWPAARSGFVVDENRLGRALPWYGQKLALGMNAVMFPDIFGKATSR
jgi:hypothetical protein